MKCLPALILLLLPLTGCLAETGSGGSAEPSLSSPCVTREVWLSTIDLRFQHCQFDGPFGVVVCEQHTGALNDEAVLLLTNEFKSTVGDYQLFSQNICRPEKPNDQWSDEEWQTFRQRPIDRLNGVLPQPIVQEIVCRLTFTEYFLEFPSDD